MNIDFRPTRHQVPRGSRPDAENHTGLHLFKRASLLRATYQIRLLLYMAQREGKVLTLHIPTSCQLGSDLAALHRGYKRSLKIERV